jgi:uncharacterized protein YjbI with pentapeptide repeats
MGLMIDTRNRIRGIAKIIISLAIILIIFFFTRATMFRFSYGRWPQWTGISDFMLPNSNYLPAKTLWDFMELLIIPFILAISALLFNHFNNKTNRDIEIERSRNTVLQSYLDRMTEILSTKTDDKTILSKTEQVIARARTITVLQSLDGERRGLVIRFLYEMNLLKEPKQIDLRDACLIDANLVDMDLSHAILDSANLSNAKLSGSIMHSASFMEANFFEADLSDTDMYGAKLNGADLFKANFKDADLKFANLTDANLRGSNITKEQLHKCYTVNGSTLPIGISKNELKNAE